VCGGNIYKKENKKFEFTFLTITPVSKEAVYHQPEGIPSGQLGSYSALTRMDSFHSVRYSYLFDQKGIF
jgi:hypothetical protein